MDGFTELIIFGIVSGFIYAFGRQILNYIPVFTRKFFGYRFFYVTQQDKVIIISRKLKEGSSELRDNQDASGYFCGWIYFGYFYVNEKFLGGLDRKVMIFCSQSFYEELLVDPNPPPMSDVSNDITLLENVSSFHIPDYKQKTISITKFPRSEQDELIRNIIQRYKIQGQGRNLTVYLHGITGTGKSMTTMMLAERINGILCKDFDPLSAGSLLSRVYAAANPSPSQPLVLVMEEVDIKITKIHKIDLPVHKMLKSGIADKTSWNNMFDDIDNGHYPFMITILTSNVPPSKINELDPAYIRPGRIHYFHEMVMNVPVAESSNGTISIEIIN